MNRLKKYHVEKRIKSGNLTDEEKELSKLIEDKLTNALIEQTKKEEEAIIMGLAAYGYRFNNRQDILNFIEKNCTVNYSLHETTFFVKGIPFLERITKIKHLGSEIKSETIYHLIKQQNENRRF